ncbi:SDR family oxidoreductase, partial [Pseudomonas mandelii]|uniref:SDR family oxidoreductase n=1 Tax=Pseudomonas mandelii TaxID=75612 RepID=UPI003D08151B
ALPFTPVAGNHPSPLRSTRRSPHLHNPELRGGPDGTRVNCVSAGPIRTLAASGIKNFRKMLAANEAQTPLRRNVTIDEVGNAGAFLCSDLASGISGEIMYVDGGFNTTAMGSLEE